LKYVVLHRGTYGKLSPQLRDTLPLIPQFDFGEAQLFPLGKIFFTFVRQIGLSKCAVDRLLYHGCLLYTTCHTARAAIEKTFLFQYRRYRFLLGVILLKPTSKTFFSR